LPFNLTFRAFASLLLASRAAGPGWKRAWREQCPERREPFIRSGPVVRGGFFGRLCVLTNEPPARNGAEVRTIGVGPRHQSGAAANWSARIWSLQPGAWQWPAVRGVWRAGTYPFPRRGDCRPGDAV